MKITIVVIVAVLITATILSFNTYKTESNTDSSDGIHFFKGSWQEAVNKAKKENKIIFLDIYATWCGPCKMLKKRTFTNKDLGVFYNNNFINIALDGEKGDGAMLMEKYNLRGFPSLLFIDGNQNVIAQTEGYYNSNELLELGKK